MEETVNQIVGFTNPPRKRRVRKSNYSKRAWKRENYLKNRAISQARKRQKRKDWVKAGKPSRDGILTPKSRRVYIKVEAPSNFSFIQNPEGVLSYLAECRRLLLGRNQITFDLSNIDHLTPDAAALLVASAFDRDFNHGLGIKGNEPKKEAPRKIFQNSNILEHVQSGRVTDRDNKNRLVHKVTNNKVENDLAKEICEIAVRHTFGKLEKFRPIYETMIECMANTNNHADPRHQGAHEWWTLLYTDPSTKVTSFCFLDLGVGILKSARFAGYVRDQVKKLLITLEGKAKIDLVPQVNRETIPKLLSGELNLSRTYDANRGKGLPAIHGYSKHPLIKNFIIITNDVYIDVAEIKITDLKHRFAGTFLYWELHPSP